MGTMRERSPGTWELVVSAGLDPATRRYRRVIRTMRSTSKREVKAALAELETAVATGKVSHDDPTLAELLERWMEHLSGLGRADTTLYHYRKYIDREIVPILGDIKLSKLKALDVDRLYTKLRKRNLAPATIRQVHAIIRASLNQAERWGLVHRNVAKLASPPSQDQREQDPPDVDEVRLLLSAAKEVDPLFGLYVRVMVAIGARRAEVGGLRWSDIDLDAGRLTVMRGYTLVPGARGDRPTKTRSVRTVTLDPGTVAELRAGWATACSIAEMAGIDVESRRAGYVFGSDPLGLEAWRPDTANAKWVKTRPRAAVVNITVVAPGVPGYLTAWGWDSTKPSNAMPSTSVLNFYAGQTRSNTTIVPLGPTGLIGVLANTSADLVIDLYGWIYAPDAVTEFAAIAPVRILDFTCGAGQDCLRQLGGIYGPSNASAWAITVTVVSPPGAGYLEVGGSGPTGTSLINFSTQTMANLAFARDNGSGAIRFRPSQTVRILVDLFGYQRPTAAGSSAASKLTYYSTNPVRVYNSTVSAGEYSVAASSTVPFTAQPVVAPTADAVLVSLVAANPTVSTYYTVWRTGTSMPGTSNLNITVPESVNSNHAVSMTTYYGNAYFEEFSPGGTSQRLVDAIGYFD